MPRHAPHDQFDYPHQDDWCSDFTPRTARLRAPTDHADQRLDDLAFRLDHLEHALKNLYAMVQELARQRTHLRPSSPTDFPGVPDHDGPDD